MLLFKKVCDVVLHAPQTLKVLIPLLFSILYVNAAIDELMVRPIDRPRLLQLFVCHTFLPVKIYLIHQSPTSHHEGMYNTYTIMLLIMK